MDDPDPEIKCDVCGEENFTPREGFYYCNECGTQSQVVRQVEVEDITKSFQADGDLNELKVRQGTRMRKKRADVMITTWECFNYALNGLTEELIALGAKDELRLTVLQLWAAYLRKMEVAFFSLKDPELPRLGVKYSRRDAKILYNHEMKRKTKKNYKIHDATKAKMNKSKVLQAEYESLTETSMNTSAASSLSIKTNKAIPLNFSTAARKYFKKLMPKSHLRKHMEDDHLEMKCHKLNKNINGVKFHGDTMYRRNLYTLLYLGLNLVEDELQLSDMLRFMREKHISNENLSHFFPENVQDQCHEIINSPKYYGRTNFHSNRMRRWSMEMCKLLRINELKMPDMSSLIQRYVKDLNLPNHITIFLMRLIKIYPPEIKFIPTRPETPCYEGRAMAYILFALKMIFGIDEKREIEISESARDINRKLDEIGEQKSKLFVFSDWLKYIEMRIILISQCHLPTSLHFEEYVNRNQFVESMKDIVNHLTDENKRNKRHSLNNLEQMFEEIYNIHKRDDAALEKPSLELPPSLTPYSTYFKEMFEDQSVQEKIFIPGFMYEDYSGFDVTSYLDTFELKGVFKAAKINLIVEQISCNQEQKVVKIVKNKGPEYLEQKQFAVRTISHDIDEEEWLERVKNRGKGNKSAIAESDAEDSNDDEENEDVAENWNEGEQTVIETQSQTVSIKSRKRKMSENTEQRVIKVRKIICDSQNTVDTDALNATSFQIFDEENMEPLGSYLKDLLKSPRRDLGDGESLFSEEIGKTDLENNSNFDKSITFKISNCDYWCFFCDTRQLTNEQFLELEAKFQPTFLKLLNLLAKTVEIDSKSLYQELMIIESNFLYNIELVTSKTCEIRKRPLNKNEHIQWAVSAYAKMW